MLKAHEAFQIATKVYSDSKYLGSIEEKIKKEAERGCFSVGLCIGISDVQAEAVATALVKNGYKVVVTPAKPNKLYYFNISWNSREKTEWLM